MKKESRLKKFWQEESGDFGIKQIAMTIGVIVVIGFVIGVMETSMGGWISEIWTMFTTKLQSMIDG